MDRPPWMGTLAGLLGVPAAGRDADAVDWRTQLRPETRLWIINDIVETLKKRFPNPIHERSLYEIQEVANGIEQKIYTTATSRWDYLKGISLKMVSVESWILHAPPINLAKSNSIVVNQNSVDQASLYSTAQTGYADAVDWQEETYQKLKSMKEMYFADLTETHRKLVMMLQKYENFMPLAIARPSDQFKKLHDFKLYLEEVLAVLQLNKSMIQIDLKDKLPVYEQQIMTILGSLNRKVTPPQQQGQQPFQHPSGHSHSMPPATNQQPSPVVQMQKQDNH